jgi:DNA-binding CsgD family transcriptional regulator
MTGMSSESALLTHLARLERLADVHMRMRSCASVGQLFAVAATAAREHCGYERAVLLDIDESHLRAAHSEPITDGDSDRLRRLTLQQPPPIHPDSIEASLIRGEHPAPTQRSTVADVLGLAEYAIEVVPLDRRPVALLVADRELPVGAVDRAVLKTLATHTSLALEQVVMRLRLAEVASELRHLTAFTQALMSETLGAPLTMPDKHGRTGVTFPFLERIEPSGSTWETLLTARELKVAQRLRLGHSNRQIAADLVLSVETVKSHVAGVLRKLGAANRSHAVAIMLGTTEAGAPEGSTSLRRTTDFTRPRVAR